MSRCSVLLLVALVLGRGPTVPPPLDAPDAGDPGSPDASGEGTPDASDPGAPDASVPLSGPDFAVAPISVTPTLGTRFESRRFNRAGGELRMMTFEGGVETSFVLTIPPGALEGEHRLSIQSLATMTGLPFSGGLAAGVLLSPQGTCFHRPVTLTISPATAREAGRRFIGFSARDDGADLHLVPVVEVEVEVEGGVRLTLRHFSLAGAAAGTPEEAAGMNAAAPDDLEALADQDEALQELGANGVPPAEYASCLRTRYQTIMKPGLDAAQPDDAVAAGAMNEFGLWFGLVQRLGVTLEDEVREAMALAVPILRERTSGANAACKAAKDISKLGDLGFWVALAQQLGLDGDAEIDLGALEDHLCVRVKLEEVSLPEDISVVALGRLEIRGGWTYAGETAVHYDPPLTLVVSVFGGTPAGRTAETEGGELGFEIQIARGATEVTANVQAWVSTVYPFGSTQEEKSATAAAGVLLRGKREGQSDAHLTTLVRLPLGTKGELLAQLSRARILKRISHFRSRARCAASSRRRRRTTDSQDEAHVTLAAPTTGATGTEQVTVAWTDPQTNAVKSAVLTVQDVSPVQITPGGASLAKGGTRQFTATVAGVTDRRLTWTAAGGTVSATGLYTAPGSPGSYTVTAPSVANTGWSATAPVNVAPDLNDVLGGWSGSATLLNGNDACQVEGNGVQLLLPETTGSPGFSARLTIGVPTPASPLGPCGLTIPAYVTPYYVSAQTSPGGCHFQDLSLGLTEGILSGTYTQRTGGPATCNFAADFRFTLTRPSSS